MYIDTGLCIYYIVLLSLSAIGACTIAIIRVFGVGRQTGDLPVRTIPCTSNPVRTAKKSHVHSTQHSELDQMYINM